MGLAIPQVITPSKASGAQIIDGSLKFDQTANTYLTRTPGSDAITVGHGLGVLG